MGLVILVTIFTLPFNGSDTLYTIGSSAINNLSAIQAMGDSAAITFTYIWIIGFILLLIAGVVGIFPLGTGVLGVVSMAMLTASPYLIYPNGQVTLSPSSGYYVIWVAAIIALIASFWHGKKQQMAAAAPPPVNVNVTQTVIGGPQGQAPPPPQAAMVRCPNCGVTVASGTARCPNCGTQLV